MAVLLRGSGPAASPLPRLVWIRGAGRLDLDRHSRRKHGVDVYRYGRMGLPPSHPLRSQLARGRGSTIEVRHRDTGEVVHSLPASTLAGSDLSRLDLRGANLRGASLKGARLEGADLRTARLEYADLEGCDLRRARMAGASLRCAFLRGANLAGADLQRQNRDDTHDALLSGADLAGAFHDGQTRWPRNFEPGERGCIPLHAEIDQRPIPASGSALDPKDLPVVCDEPQSGKMSRRTQGSSVEALPSEGVILNEAPFAE
jgi:hypothetical protein